jgi:LacI family transcriptional regulator
MPAPKRILFASPWWHADIVNGVLRHAAARGWHVDLQTCLSGVLPERWEGDGMVTQLSGNHEQLLRLIEQCGCPAVSLNNNFPDIPMPRVSTDGEAAGRLAAEHLLERGFRSFAFYAHGIMGSARRSRYTSFDRTLRTAGYRADPLLWEEEIGQYEASWFGRQQWLVEKLTALAKPLGVFAFNDQGAVEVIEACMSAGIAIPDQVAVLGMLNMDIFRHSTTVGLSSIAYDFDHMTGLACDVLLSGLT